MCNYMYILSNRYGVKDIKNSNLLDVFVIAIFKQTYFHLKVEVITSDYICH